MKLLDSDRSNLEKAALMLHFYDIPENKLVFVQCNSISVFKYKLHVYFSCFDMKLNNRICFQRLNVDLYHHRPYPNHRHYQYRNQEQLVHPAMRSRQYCLLPQHLFRILFSSSIIQQTILLLLVSFLMQPTLIFYRFSLMMMLL